MFFSNSFIFTIIAIVVISVVLFGAGVFIYKTNYPSRSKLEERIKELTNQISLTPNKAELYRERAELRLKTAVPSGVDQYLPQNVTLRNELLESALLDLKKVSELNPSKENTYALNSLRVTLFIYESKLFAYLSDIEAWIGRKQTNIDTDWVSLINSEKSKNVEGMKLIDECLKVTPNKTQLLLAKSKLSYLLGEKDIAYNIINSLIKEGLGVKINPALGMSGGAPPEIVHWIYFRTIFYLIDKKYTEAKKDMDLTVELWPNYADIYLNRAYFFRLVGDRENAFQDIEHAIQQRPNSKELYEKLKKEF